MTAPTKPPIIGTTVAVWSDAFRGIAAMPVPAGITFVILLVLTVLNDIFLPDSASGESTAVVSGFFSSMFYIIIESFLIAPLAIAVHRYVLLGEVATGYAIGSRPRYIRFVGFALLLNMLMMSPALIFMVLPTLPTGWGVIGIGAVGGIVAFALFAVFLMALRRAILFPAIAIDAPGATWTNARNDTKGNSWRVLFILICTAIPVLVISAPLDFMLLSPPGGATTGRIVFSVLSTVISIPSVCAFAAVASHLFRALANRLAIPPATPRTA